MQIVRLNIKTWENSNNRENIAFIMSKHTVEFENIVENIHM